jgi:hypothetical protein
MNALANFIFKLGMMDRFGYTMVHAAIDVALIFGLAFLLATGLVALL